MKQCPSCGTRQSDDRTTCVDCGSFLGDPLSEREEAAAEAAIDAAVAHEIDPSDNFAVTRRQKLLGIASIVCIVGMLVLICVTNNIRARYVMPTPPGIIVHETDYQVVTMVDGEMVITDNPHAGEMEACNRAVELAWIGILPFAFAAVSFLCPRLVWWYDTRYARRYATGELLPNRHWVAVYRVLCYVMFALGLICAAVAIFTLI